MHDTLELELRLLVARNGKARVLGALAAIEEVDLTVLEGEIEKLEATAKRRKQRRKRGAAELVEEADLDEISRPIVEKIAYAYENKQFLSDLRSVKRFLESQGVAASKVRSRVDALPKVIAVLARQSPDGLEKLVSESETSGRGDLGVIADQILGQSRRPTGT